MHPMLRRLLFSLPAILIFATAGYFLLPWLGLDKLSTAGLFATGISLGIIIGALKGPASTTTTQPSTAAEQTAKAMKQALSSAPSADNDNGERKTVFVGNLAYRASPRQLRELFEPYGTVHSVRIATDRTTRKPRGFGFVEMNAADAGQAIKDLHGNSLCSRELNLSEAKQRENS